MTERELTDWGAGEAKQRTTDLAYPMTQAKLETAQRQAKARRSLVGLTRSQAARAISLAEIRVRRARR